MGVAGLTLRDFRCYEQAEVALAEGLTVITGPNGAGKTNLLEALYFGCTGRSCRTTNEREIVRFGAGTTRVVVRCEAQDGAHELAVGFTPGEPKRMRVDGAVVERLLDAPARPLVSVFLPDRLELIKGAPALRRAHLDQLVTALWPARAGTRRAYAQSLAQRNALLTRIRAGQASQSGLESWDLQLARHGITLMADRARAVQTISDPYRTLAQELGLEGGASVSYRPRSRATSAQDLAAELAERRAADLDRGFTGHGPHRDDVLLQRAERDLRAYGSQGQQRLGLLTLLLAERDAIATARDSAPLMLLDDVMSELDHVRREALVALLRDGPGQSVITTTDLEHIPGASSSDVRRVAVDAGRILTAAALAG
ncbi:MAG: replication and repair protein RecF [Solirubrobacteraceae bacterium]|nr:replication and repair protein RecF [Solirubrobacteraceae bacterium]